MARRLFQLKLVLGHSLVAVACCAQSACSQQQSSEPAVPSAAVTQAVSQENPKVGEGKKPHGDKPDRRERGGRGDGDRREVNIFEAIRREGGPLELLPLLMNKPVRTELGLSDADNAKVETYVTEMHKRIEEAYKIDRELPVSELAEAVNERLKKENEKFEAFLNELPVENRDRLVGVFVQYRSLRSLSNRMVAVDKLGMTSEAAQKLRDDINRIRRETMRENEEEMRRMFENGPRSFQENQFQQMVHRNKAKIDSRIEKLIDKSHQEKLAALRGKELPGTLLETLDRPPGPPPGSPPGPK